MTNWYHTIIEVLLFAIIVSLVAYIERYEVKPRIKPIPELTRVQYERYIELSSKNIIEAYRRGKESK